MARRRVLALAVACAVVVVAGCSHPFIGLKNQNSTEYIQSAKAGGYTILYSPATRARAPELFFKEEFDHVNASMALSGARALGASNKTLRPEKLIGLGLSGGGLRSNAFQLGLLSALHEAKGREYSNGTVEDSTALDNIAYISSVSGGTWAAAGMMSFRSRKPRGYNLDDFFSELRATTIEDRSRARCASGYMTKADDCQDNATKILNNSYGPTILNLPKIFASMGAITTTAGYTAREAWREMLLSTSLLGRDRSLGEMLLPLDGARKWIKDEVGPGHTKPFWIINATHSAGGIGNIENHFNFQITPLGVGAMADCGSTRYCGFTGGYGGFYKPFDKLGKLDQFPPITVSHAMAISGAVLPESILGQSLGLLEWHFPMPKPDSELLQRMASIKASADTPVRETYTLADGGHSENYGALALMERGVDLLIVSDASYDDGYTFGDYKALKHHSAKLLNTNFAVNATGTAPQGAFTKPLPLLTSYDPNHPNYPPGTEVATAIRNDLDVYFANATTDTRSTINAGAYLGQYRALVESQNGTVRDSLPAKHVLYLRPPYDITGFLKYLRDKDNAATLARKAEYRAKVQLAVAKQKAAQNIIERNPRHGCLHHVLNEAIMKLDSYAYDYPVNLREPHPDHSSAADNATKIDILETARTRLNNANVAMMERGDRATIRRIFAGVDLYGYGNGTSLLQEYVDCSTTWPSSANRAQQEKNAAIQDLEKLRDDIRSGKTSAETGYMATYHYLNLNRTEFPRDKTFVSSYDRELIFAYFLLGKYMGEEKLVPLLKEYLSQIKQADSQLGPAGTHKPTRRAPPVDKPRPAP